MPEEAAFAELCKVGHPLDVERAEAALNFTAKISLGTNHQVFLHSYTDPNKVAAQLQLIAEQRYEDLGGSNGLKPVLVADAFGTFSTAYLFGDDERSLQRFVRQRQSPLFVEAAAVQ